MLKRPKRPRDPMQRAKFIIDIATGEAPPDLPMVPETLATAAKRKGGVKGGKARAKKLSDRKRSEIAQRAARMRWAAKGKE